MRGREESKQEKTKATERQVGEEDVVNSKTGKTAIRESQDTAVQGKTAQQQPRSQERVPRKPGK